jgi:hypothetical protein
MGAPNLFAVAGGLLGLLLATEPLAALAPAAVVLGLASVVRPRAAITATLIGAAPGVALLLAANHAATGSAWSSPAAIYRALAEPEALRSPAHALRDAVRLAREHLVDVANLEPLVLLAWIPFVGRARTGATVLAGLLALGHAAVFAPTMRLPASNSPVDSASSLIAIVPIEHALMAIALTSLSGRRLGQVVLATLALSLAGFAVHGAPEHAALAASGIGRPAFEPDALRDGNVTHGLLLFDDEAGYELASDPGVLPSHGVQAARMRGDDHDRALYDALDHPPSRRYSASPAGISVASFVPPYAGSSSWRFEAENEWPPVFAAVPGAAVQGGAEPIDAAPVEASPIDALGRCASGRRALRVRGPGTSNAQREATVVLALPLPSPSGAKDGTRAWTLVPRVFQGGNVGTGTLSLVAELGRGAEPLAEWSWSDRAPLPGCLDLPPQSFRAPGSRATAWLVVRAVGGDVSLDALTLYGDGAERHGPRDR